MGNLFNTFTDKMRASTTAQMKSRMKSWTSAKLPWCYRSVTINRIYFLHLTCCRASVLWYLSRPPTADKERLGCFHHAVDAGDLQVLHPHVGDGHQCWALLWCKELAASMAPCCENIPHRSIGSQMVHSLCPPGRSVGLVRKCRMLLAIKRRGHQL